MLQIVLLIAAFAPVPLPRPVPIKPVDRIPTPFDLVQTINRLEYDGLGGVASFYGDGTHTYTWHNEDYQGTWSLDPAGNLTMRDLTCDGLPFVSPDVWTIRWGPGAWKRGEWSHSGIAFYGSARVKFRLMNTTK